LSVDLGDLISQKPGKRGGQRTPSEPGQMNIGMALGGQPRDDTQHIKSPLTGDKADPSIKPCASQEVIAAIRLQKLIIPADVRLGIANAAHITGKERRLRFGLDEFPDERFVAQFRITGAMGNIEHGALRPRGGRDISGSADKPVTRAWMPGSVSTA